MYVSKDEWDHFEQKFAELLQISLSNPAPDPYRTIKKKIQGNFGEKFQYFIIFNGLIRVRYLFDNIFFRLQKGPDPLLIGLGTRGSGSK
jgi:hypothetical protein